MTETKRHTKVRSRNEAFVERMETRIWQETPSDTNPYIASSASCHGYDLHELLEKRSFVDVFYLLFRGELPTSDESALLNALMIGLINPGPRHPATRAAMNVAAGKTLPVHILPVAVSVLGGDYLGGGVLDEAMRFLRKHQNSDPQRIIDQIVEQDRVSNGVDNKLNSGENEDAVASEVLSPGFGKLYGGIDLVCEKTAAHITTLPGAGSALSWAKDFAALAKQHNFGWLPTGLAAAVFADLGFQPKAGASLFQLLGAPGMLAHGLELANKPMTAMPFIKDENYIIEGERQGE